MCILFEPMLNLFPLYCNATSQPITCYYYKHFFFIIYQINGIEFWILWSSYFHSLFFTGFTNFDVAKSCSASVDSAQLIFGRQFLQQLGFMLVSQNNRFLLFSCNMNTNKLNAKLQRTDPSTKVSGEFSTKGRIFQQNRFLLIYIIIVKNILMYERNCR